MCGPEDMQVHVRAWAQVIASSAARGVEGGMGPRVPVRKVVVEGETAMGSRRKR